MDGGAAGEGVGAKPEDRWERSQGLGTSAGPAATPGSGGRAAAAKKQLLWLGGPRLTCCCGGARPCEDGSSREQSGGPGRNSMMA